MAEVSRRQAHALAPLLLVACVALLSVLAFNLRNLDPGEEALPPPVVTERDPGAGGIGGSGEGLRDLFFAVIVILFASVAAGIVFVTLQGVKPWSLVTRWELLGYFLAVAFIVSVFLFWNGIHAGLEGVIRWVTGERESGSGTGEAPPALPFGTTPSTLLLIVAVAIVGVYAIVFAVGLLPRLASIATYTPPDVRKSKKELARAVRTAIADLESGGDFRDAVLRCYRSMVLLFEARGRRVRPEQTAREFEAEALASVGVSRAGVDELTSLFEEARYSTHAIGAAHRDAAIASLTAVRKELEAAA